MLAGRNYFPAPPPAIQRLLVGCWRARKPPFTQNLFNAQHLGRSYSSISDAMLQRAVKDFEASNTNPRNDLAKQLFSSSPAVNGSIEEQFKRARQASQSIGGFAGLVNSYANPQNPLRARSPNIKQGLKRKSSSLTASSVKSTGLSSVLDSHDPFRESPDTIDLKQSESMHSATVKAVQAVEFDENDFDDDDDIDLDMDFVPLSAMPMAAPPKPLQRESPPSLSPYALPQLPRSNSRPQSFNKHASSLQTWSSSSPSHKLTPPGALTRKQNLAPPGPEPSTLSSQPPNPRPAKRRTLPWAQKQAEEAAIAAQEEELEEMRAERVTTQSSAFCFACREEGHFMNRCPNRGASAKSKANFTPLPKDKGMPWNTTASAMKEQKKAFQTKRDKSKKAETMAQDAVEKRIARPSMPPISLSDEQSRVLDLVVNQSKSVFFTGSAGTGKSVLMRAIIAELRKRHVREPDRIAVTASTGLAACNIGGVTLHSFGGIGLGKEDIPALVKKIRRNQKAKNRWLRTKILVIDEISMVDGDLFDKLEGIARALRNNGRPFGGIQLVITGDFFQLPPVPDYDSRSRDVKFAFDAATWPTAIHHTIGLTEVFRQKDPVFANMLNEMRLGRITQETVTAFRKLSRKINYGDGMIATELFPTRQEVENSNAFRMRDLHGKSYRYEAKDSGTITDEKMREKLLANMMAPKTIELKKGAQVMLIKNMDDGLVNGSLGKVIAFMNERTFEIYDHDPDVLDEAVSPDELSESGQKVRASMKQQFGFGKDGSDKDGREYPLVRFQAADGTSRDLLVQTEDWKIELPSGEVQAQRTQLPLILAWALSIHKAQGQTLERVKIDLKKIFEKGQAYVALSRATSQAGLEVQNFDKSKVMAHPKVAQFYESLYSVNKALEHPKIAKPPRAVETKAGKRELVSLETRAQAFDDEDDIEEVMAAYG